MAVVVDERLVPCDEQSSRTGVGSCRCTQKGRAGRQFTPIAIDPQQYRGTMVSVSAIHLPGRNGNCFRKHWTSDFGHTNRVRHDRVVALEKARASTDRTIAECPVTSEYSSFPKQSIHKITLGRLTNFIENDNRLTSSMISNK